jgi:diacylglycerol kinase (ATP)
MSRGRLLVALNPGASRVQELADTALTALSDAGFEFVVHQRPDSQALGKVLCDNARRFDAIVVAGGDGSVHAVLPALLDAGKPVGILPLGTANDLALTLGIPSDPIAAVGVIAAGHRRRVDVGKVNGVPFVNAASIGLAVDVAEHQNVERKRKWGVLSYVFATLEALGDADRFHAVVDCDGQCHEVFAYQIAVGNGIHYGGGMKIAPDASFEDGLFDVYAIETHSVAELVALAPAFRAGTHGDSPDVSVFRCRRLRIETRTPASVSADGEVATETPADFTMLPGALEFLTPQLRP